MHRTNIARDVKRARCLVAALTLVCAVGAGANNAAWSQDGGSPKAQGAAAGDPAGPAKTVKVRGRLPAYFSRVVSQEQREKIYGIQATFAEQLAKLEMQIREVEAARDKQVRDVLTVEQKKQVDAMLAAAKARRSGQPAAEPDPPANGEPAAGDGGN